ncbi:hypothetical protein BH11MYX3_BH11MYX3_07950 [soil metagenome]
MRIACSLLATLALSTSIAQPVAEACGGDYRPRAPAMFVVTHHHGRSVVLLDKNVPDAEKLDWKGELRTYDDTTFAAAPSFTTAMTATLVGAKSARTPTSRNHVFVSPAWEGRQPMNALEIFPRGDAPLLAIAGDHQDARFTGLDSAPTGLETIAWAQSPGFSPALDPGSIYVQTVHGENLDLITAYVTDGNGPVTYVRPAGQKPWGGYRGSPMGVVTVDGVRYMVLVNAGLLTPIRI